MDIQPASRTVRWLIPHLCESQEEYTLNSAKTYTESVDNNCCLLRSVRTNRINYKIYASLASRRDERANQRGVGIQELANGLIGHNGFDDEYLNYNGDRTA